MDAQSQRSLERELMEGFQDIEPAKDSRLEILVRDYLLHKASTLAGKRMRNENDVLALIHLHSRVALLQAVIERPKQFNLKEMKELFRGTLIVEANDAAERKKDDPVKSIMDSGMSNEQKAELVKGLTDAAKERFRAQIEHP